MLYEVITLLTFGDLLNVVDVRGTGMDFDGIRLHGGRGAHVGGQLFQLDLHLGSGGLGVLLGIGTDDGDGVTSLENFGIAEDRTLPAISQVGGEGDQAGNAVFALNVFMGNP